MYIKIIQKNFLGFFSKIFLEIYKKIMDIFQQFFLEFFKKEHIIWIFLKIIYNY